MTTLVIDLTIMAIIVFCGWRGYRNGLIRGVFGTVTLIVALVIANIVASAYSEEVSGVMKPFVGGIIDSTFSEMIKDDQEIEFEPVEHENNSTQFKTSYTALRRFGLPAPAAISIAEKVADDEGEGFLADLISDKLSSMLAYVALFGVAFLLLAIIFAVVGNLISFVFSLPGLKTIDMVAGVLFGLAKGLLIVLAIATVIRYFGLVALSTLEETTILNYFVNHNQIAELLKI